MDDRAYVRPLSEYVRMLKRRRLQLFLPAFVLVPTAFVIAFKLPTTYQSSAMIQIKEAVVSEDYVRSATTSYGAQRVQVITNRVLTSENVSRIVDDYGLYRAVVGTTRMADEFRNSVEVDLVNAESVDERTGRPTETTIGFTVAFSDPSPEISQKVAAELVEVFLDEDLRERTERAGSTADFLANEVARVAADLEDAELRMAEFKSANEGNLPEFYQRNLVNLESVRRESVETEFRIQELETRRFDLQSKMTQVSPTAPVYTSTGDVVMSDLDRLKALQSEYRRKVALYKDSHPDLKRLEREIATLQVELGTGDGAEDLIAQLQEQKQYLAELRTRYSDDHQAVVTTRRIILQLEDRVERGAIEARESEEPVADNPAYVVLQGELFSTESELRTLNARRKELSRQLTQYESMIATAPEVEKEYKALQRELGNNTDEYKAIKAKQRGAVVARNLEQNDQGGSFVLLEPPVVPQDPVSPNRPSIILVGIVLAIGAGLGFAVLRELTDSAIHGVRELTVLMGEAPLAAVPYIENEADMTARRRGWFFGSALALTIAVAFYDFSYGLIP